MKRAFLFDLDGTITEEELLPIIASSVGLEDEVRILTELTLKGLLDFKDSMKLRFSLLKQANLKEIHQAVGRVRLNKKILSFINNNIANSFIVTGNINHWIQPLKNHIKCQIYSSEAVLNEFGTLGELRVLKKNEAALEIRKMGFDSVVAIGDSYNDIPMFESSDIRIAYGGVHPPVNELVKNANYITYDGERLCRLLKMLS